MGVHTGKRKFMYVIVLLFVWDNHTKRNGFKITLVIAYDKCQLTMCRRVKEQRCVWKIIERWILDEKKKWCLFAVLLNGMFFILYIQGMIL